jgi:hypothetical protein
MNAEIQQFFGLESLDDAFDAMEAELFEIKQFFLTKPLLWKTAQPKLKRLAQFQQFETAQSTASINVVPNTFLTNEILTPTDWWKMYSQFKLNWKTNVTQAFSAGALISCINEGIAQEEQLLLQIADFNELDGQPVFGKEPDPMVLQHGFSVIAQHSIQNWQEIIKNKDKFTFDFLVALKRLSLLRQYLTA